MRGIQYPSKTKPFYFVNSGACYNFLQEKGTVSINFNNIFNTMHFRFSGDFPFEQSGEFQGETQTVFLGLSYRFGSGKNRKIPEKEETKMKKSGKEYFIKSK